ncbi:MAG: di-trans,poly-cis-decaprenylcistransferase [Candidatus Nealsonbacteria bacterium RBG_13_36_15]|uniref:Isoprenyl transferase n=1 Tax=Candidatus Nealsonbacteria bacterium RBG_13_36_15 TaxID=1801660 RepID=A0A1G2DX38_9BACT|nr:MAG: di-trans,poly-cis-decaprenylcistransferase [Candidatus Nealsonbacteria bacterium RBG_13_36_15]
MKKIPTHLAIIIDGNRRWAEKKGLPVFEGHRQGLKKVKKIAEWCKERGVKILTLFAFSTENWSRPKAEVNHLMRLLGEAFAKSNIEQANKKGIKIQIIGQRQRLPKYLQKIVEKAESLTKNNKAGVLNIALSYGGRAEITDAMRRMMKGNPRPPKRISEKLVEKHLWTANLPSPDLIIRTGGEHRLSNFLLWQAAYSELYFSKKYWPDFTERDLDKAFETYVIRQRRFGK